MSTSWSGLGPPPSGGLSEDRVQKIEQFIDVVGRDESHARFFLELTNWDLTAAVAIALPPPRPAAPPPAAAYRSLAADVAAPPQATVVGEPAGASDDALVTAEVVAVEFAPPVAAAGSSSTSSEAAAAEPAYEDEDVQNVRVALLAAELAATDAALAETRAELAETRERLEAALLDRPIARRASASWRTAEGRAAALSTPRLLLTREFWGAPADDGNRPRAASESRPRTPLRQHSAPAPLGDGAAAEPPVERRSSTHFVAPEPPEAPLVAGEASLYGDAFAKVVERLPSRTLLPLRAVSRGWREELREVLHESRGLPLDWHAAALRLQAHLAPAAGTNEKLRPHRLLVSKEIDLSGRGLEPRHAAGVAALLVLSESATSLNLGDNEIGDDGCIALAKALRSATIHTLSLWRGDVSDRGAIALARALPHSRLLALSLEHNDISDDGAEAFARALPYCTLKTIHLGSTNFSRWGKELLRELPHVRAGRVAVRGVGFGQPVQERRDQCF